MTDSNQPSELSLEELLKLAAVEDKLRELIAEITKRHEKRR